MKLSKKLTDSLPFHHILSLKHFSDWVSKSLSILKIECWHFCYIDGGYLGNSAYNQLCFITRDRVPGLVKWVIIGSGNGLLLVRHSVKHFNNIWIKLQNSLRNAFENVMAKRQLLWWPNARLVTPLLTHWSYLELLFTKRLPRFSALVLESCSIQFGLLFRIPEGFWVKLCWAIDFVEALMC